jgi:uncharacterized protein (DUF58 family)
MTRVKRFALVTAATFLLLSASLVHLGHLYYMAALILALPIASLAVSVFTLRGLSFEREVPGTAWEDETATFVLKVTNAGYTPRLFLRALDQLPQWIRPVADEPPLFDVPGRATARIPYEADLLKRGAYTIPAVTVVTQDPLGIFYFRKTLPCKSEILVYPRPQRIPDVLLSGAERFGFRDMPIAAARGYGVDIDGVREYVPGDPLRRMHWKSVARTGRLNVIEFEESRSINIVLVLDCRAGSDVGEGLQTSFEYLVRTAASLAHLGIRQGASVRLVCGEEPDPANAMGRGTDHMLEILACLARAEANDPNYLGDRLVQRVGHVQPGTSLVILTSSVDTVLPGPLLHYASAGAQITVIYADPTDFSARGGALPTAEERSAYIQQLSTSNATLLLLRRTADRQIDLQPITDVRGIFAGN